MTFIIQEQTRSDRVVVSAVLEGDQDYTIAMALFFPKSRNGHIWSGAAILADLTERPGGMGKALYDTSLDSVRALVAHEASVAPVEAILRA